MKLCNAHSVRIVPTGDGDHRIALGLGLDGERPDALILLCPCEGVDHILRDLVRAKRQVGASHRHHGAAFET